MEPPAPPPRPRPISLDKDRTCLLQRVGFYCVVPPSQPLPPRHSPPTFPTPHMFTPGRGVGGGGRGSPRRPAILKPHAFAAWLTSDRWGCVGGSRMGQEGGMGARGGRG